MLVPLSIATAWTQAQARRAEAEHEWHLVGHSRLWIRRAAITLTVIVSFMNCGALFELVRALLQGHGGTASTLLVDAPNIWATNLIIFTLRLWSTDRGGPRSCGLVERAHSDSVFAQITLPDQGLRHWITGNVDYFFLAFTNATAFSPTDILPMTHRAKLVMMVEATISLLTVGLVAARAVNILA